jgi:hypothetical protein
MSELSAKTGGLIEKAAGHETSEMIGLTRSSSQEVAEGYGPSIQRSELVADAQSQGYQLRNIRDIVEPATISLEERDLFNEVLAEAVRLKQENRCEGLSFSRCDRLSRHFDAALQIALDGKKHGCTCMRSDPARAYPLCPSPRIPWRKFSDQVWDTFVQCIMGLDTLEMFVDDKRRAWKKQKASIERQKKKVQEQLNKLQQKRRQYSWQQAEGIITDEELLAAHRQLKSEADILNGQLKRLEEFSEEPAPPDKATFERMAAFWRGDIVGELDHASDELRANFA